jgi:hypothetical protein
VDVEGRTLRLTGTADEQYREWQRLLHELYLEETGGKTGTPAPTTSSTSSSTTSVTPVKVAVEQPASAPVRP